jgi:hypothetical protein
MPRTLLASRLSPPGPGPLLHRKLSHRRRSRNDLVMEQTWGLRPASSSATGSSGSSPSLPPASCTFPTARSPQSGRALYTLELNVTAHHVTTLWSSCDYTLELNVTGPGRCAHMFSACKLNILRTSMETSLNTGLDPSKSLHRTPHESQHRTRHN